MFLRSISAVVDCLMVGLYGVESSMALGSCKIFLPYLDTMHQAINIIDPRAH